MVQKDDSNNDNNNKRRAKGEKKRGKIVNLCATRAKKSNDRRPTIVISKGNRAEAEIREDLSSWKRGYRLCVPFFTRATSYGA